jgi:hypothetical protein
MSEANPQLYETRAIDPFAGPNTGSDPAHHPGNEHARLDI